MKYTIQREGDGLVVQIEADPSMMEGLLAGFEACRDGSCRCPISDYGKLKALHIETEGGRIHLRLEANGGTRIDPAEIEQCLAFRMGGAEKD